MFNIGPLELMVLLVMALIVFGPAKLPELMASVHPKLANFVSKRLPVWRRLMRSANLQS